MTFDVVRAAPHALGLLALAILTAVLALALPQQTRGDTLVPGGLNGKVAFVSDRAFAMPEEGSDRSETCTPANEGAAPAGDDECAFDIFTMNPDGSGVVNLTGTQAGENDAYDDEPSWSPDGTKIAFVSRRDCVDDADPTDDTCTPDLWVMNADGSAPRQLTDACGVDEDPEIDGCRLQTLGETHPSWSPDGTKLVFSRGGLRNMDSDIGDLHTISSNGTPGDESELTTGGGGDGETSFDADLTPYWSPDGSKIYFSRFQFDALGLGGLSTLPRDLPRDILEGKVESRQLDGLLISFSLHTFAVASGGGDAEPIGTPDECLVEEAGPLDGCLLDLNPAASPDGSRISIQRSIFDFVDSPGRDTDIVSFSSTDGSGESELQAGDEPNCGVLPEQGERVRCLGDFKPAYSPQGDRLVFHSDRVETEAETCGAYFAVINYGGCQSAIYTMSPSGDAISGPLGRTALVAGEGPITDRNPDWQRLEPPKQPQPAACASDSQGPDITITSLQGRRNYKKGARASVRITASDPSGLSVDPSTSSRRISTRSTGRKTLSVAATDACGNSSTERFVYVVASDPRVSAGGVAGRSGSCTFSSFTVRVRVSSPARMRRVDVLVDRKRIKRTTKKRFRVRVNTLRLKPGRHTFRVVATDRAGNRTVQRTRFRRCGAISPFFTG